MADSCDVPTTRRRLTELAAAIGFDALAVATVAPLPEPYPSAYRTFLDAGFPADMDYLGDHAAARVDPAVRWPWARTVLVLAVHYDRGRPVSDLEYAGGYPVLPAAAVPAVHQTIARYAQGRDYHRVIDNALRLFKDAVVATPELGITRAHYHSDTGPVLERPWAHQAGLGWLAKNGLIIRPGAGSFLFLAEIFLDRGLPPDPPATDHCGACTRCIDACPTQAIVADRIVDPRKCISWMNIEKRTALTPAETEQLHGWLFGCDICQNVCPHNTKIAPFPPAVASAASADGWPQQFADLPSDSPVELAWYRNPDRPLRKVLAPDLWQTAPALTNLTWAQAAQLTEPQFDELKQGTALRRVPYANFHINAQACAAYWQTEGDDAG